MAQEYSTGEWRKASFFQLRTRLVPNKMINEPLTGGLFEETQESSRRDCAVRWRFLTCFDCNFLFVYRQLVQHMLDDKKRSTEGARKSTNGPE